MVGLPQQSTRPPLLPSPPTPLTAQSFRPSVPRGQQYPMLGFSRSGQQAPIAPPQVYNLGTTTFSDTPELSVVRGTLLVFNSRASVLFDTGASHSFISSTFASALDLEVDCLGSTLTVDTPIGGLVPLDRVCRNCEIIISDQNLRVDFIIIDMSSFDVILGMDWLSAHRAFIDCFRRRVNFPAPV